VTAIVGNYIGQGDEKLAKLSVLIGVLFTGMVTCTLGFVTYRYAESISSMYTEEEDLILVLVPLMESLSIPLVLSGFVQSF